MALAEEGNGNVSMPVNVYCSLVKCALQNSTLGFQSSLLNPGNQGGNSGSLGKMNDLRGEKINEVVNCLMKVSDGELSGLKMPNPPEAKKECLNGELKDSIDRIKSELFSHYSFYFNLEEYDIPTRLQILSSHSDSRADLKDLAADEEVRRRVSAEARGMKSNSVMEMLDSLKGKFESLTERLNLLEAELENEVLDPNVREFQYSRETKRVMGVEDLEDVGEMREHILNLYAHLHKQSKANQKKIDVLQKKLLTLTAHTRLTKRPDNDKRNGL